MSFPSYSQTISPDGSTSITFPRGPWFSETDERVAVDEALAGTGIGAIVLPDLLAGLEIVFGYLVCLADQYLVVSGHSHRLLVIDIAE